MKHCEMIIDYLTDGTDFEYNDNRGVLIRCKDCLYNDGDNLCRRLNGLAGVVHDDDFCSRAKSSLSLVNEWIIEFNIEGKMVSFRTNKALPHEVECKKNPHGNLYVSVCEDDKDKAIAIANVERTKHIKKVCGFDLYVE